MDFIIKLRNKGVIITELQNEGSNFRKKWEDAFANNLSKKDKKLIFFEQYLWHVFSYEKLACLKSDEAKNAFNNKMKKSCFVFYQHFDIVYFLENVENLVAEDFYSEMDVYVVNKNFKWTYIRTHEMYCGPYFYSSAK